MNALRRLVRFLAVTLFVGAAVIALLIGAFQLLVTRLPSYQDEVQAWVTAELGLELDYAQLDAALSWRGPELAFRDVQVRAVGDAAPFLTARGANVGFNALDLLGDLVRGRQVGVDRLTFDGTELTLVKTETGAYRLQGAPGAPGRDELRVEVPPDIDVLVRNSRVLYLDALHSLAWDFQNVAGSLRRDADIVTLEASARPPADFGERIEVNAQATVVAGETVGARFTGDWRLSVDVNDVDIAVAQQLFPATTVVPEAGRGDVAVWLEWQGGALAHGTAQVALADVELTSTLGADDSRYERIALSADWQHTGESWRFAVRDIAVSRGGRTWPADTSVDIDIAREPDGSERFALRSTFLRLEDLTPFLAPLQESRLVESWRALEPRGDLRAVDVAVERTLDERVDYTVAGEFLGLGVEPFEGLPGLTGLTGQVRADSRTGRVELASTDVGLDWQTLFRTPLDVSELRGILVWRTGQDAVRLVSDDLVIATPDATLRSNLELTLPMDGTSPVLDLNTELSEFDIAAAPRYLPASKMPRGVVTWLDQALRGGRAASAQVAFVGPVQSFPFEGDEGEFRATLQVEDIELAFVRDWPTAQELAGTVEFVNARFEARGSGRMLGNRTENLLVRFDDLRTGEVTVQANTTGGLDQVLAFLNGAPMIRGYLGQDFARLEAWAGTGDVALDLMVPLRNRTAYRLTAGLTIAGGDIGYRGFPPHVTEVFGSLLLADGVLRGEGVQGIFLDGPVTATVDAAGQPGYRARMDFDGEVTIDAVVDAFNLPYGELMAGQTAWRGSLLIPSGPSTENDPARVTIDSNLSGVALRFPEPFAKPPGEPTNLELEVAFPPSGLTMSGNIGATRRFALDFDATSGQERPFKFRRAALEFGGELAEFRADDGVTLNGSLPVLRGDDWLALLKQSSDTSSAGAGWSGVFAGADLAVANFSVFGQQLGSSQLTARRRTDDWQLDIESDAIAGTLLVPIDLKADPQIVAVMRRVYLNPGDGSGAASDLDPRDLPGLQLHADEFGIGQRQLGRLDAEILSDPLGLRLVSFESATDAFSAEGSGGWFMGDDGDTTRFAVSINSTNVGQMLNQLGFAPFVEAESAEITASLFWPGPPSGSWLDHMGGDLALRVETGSLVDVSPGGAGRAAGLLSISALPRRLALDFRDVFNRGLVFDDITADFVIVDGNAYTDNLKLTGPVAEVGLIGRTGFRDRDYRQQAVVTAEPGKVLPTVGALLAGPQVAAALLLFTRIFKKPLGGIGRASYCVTGTWTEPVVERLTDEQLEQGSLCAEMAPNRPLPPAGEN